MWIYQCDPSITFTNLIDRWIHTYVHMRNIEPQPRIMSIVRQVHITRLVCTTTHFHKTLVALVQKQEVNKKLCQFNDLHRIEIGRQMMWAVSVSISRPLFQFYHWAHEFQFEPVVRVGGPRHFTYNLWEIAICIHAIVILQHFFSQLILT